HAIKGGGTRAFSRWLTRDYVALFPQIPERTRLARLFKTHTAWTARFLAAPTVLGVADSYGIELIHPMREGRSPAQIGKKGNMKICPRGTWNTRMLVETVFSMLTTVFHSKKVGHRVWTYFRARVAWTMAAFNLLARWSMEVDEHEMVRLSIAEFSL